jgi:AraC-like DNA-binding protein
MVEQIRVSSTGALEHPFLKKACEIVSYNMSDGSFCVEKMADAINISRTQLHRKLKALTGMAPGEFIKDIRLKRAAELILAKTDNISQISYSLGFNDQSYFTKCFKKQFGVAPSEYISRRYCSIGR